MKTSDIVIQDLMAHQERMKAIRADFHTLWNTTFAPELLSRGVHRADLPEHEMTAWIVFKHARGVK